MKVVAHGVLRARRRLVLGLALVGVLSATAAAPLVMARPGEPDRKQRVIALSVAALMERRHISQTQLDDKISGRALEMFFETLDPMKLYFYQSDVDNFSPESTRIDDFVREGDVSLAKRIFDVFLKRVAERTEVAQKLVDVDHDFDATRRRALAQAC
jgi:carboxyl-terminal processing protease